MPLISDTGLQNLHISLVFKPPGLQLFVTAALGHKDAHTLSYLKVNPLVLAALNQDSRKLPSKACLNYHFIVNSLKS